MTLSRREFVAAASGGIAALGLPAGAQATLNTPAAGPPGIALETDVLRLRITDNSPRFYEVSGHMMSGANGIASLIHKQQRKNIVCGVSANLEYCSVSPPSGALQDRWDAPRHAPATLEQIGPRCARLFWKASEASGMNVSTEFALDGHYVDHTITLWPDADVESVDILWASWMNNPQNTSLFLHGMVEGETAPRLLEVSRVAHGPHSPLLWRGFEADTTWDGHLRDNPVLRQSVEKDDSTKQHAALAAGFSASRFEWTGDFYYGLIDEYLYLMIFREPEFFYFISPTGGVSLRLPAWDYGIKSGAQRAGEKRNYHGRLVYKPFVSVADVLKEVADFRRGAVS